MPEQQVPSHLPGTNNVHDVIRYFCYYSSCRVQVKLPGGGSTVFSLAASDSLSLLRTKVSQVNIIHVTDILTRQLATCACTYCTVLELNRWQSMYKEKKAVHTPK